MKHFKILFIFLIGILVFGCSDDDENSEHHLSDEFIEKRQAVVGGITLPACVDITVFIDPTCDWRWQSQTAAALNQYNDVPGIAINMEMTSTLPADIVIDCTTYPAGTSFIALGEWPEVNNTIGGQIFINSAFDEECEDLCWYRGVMMHEIGHNLGLTHGEQEGAAALNTGPWVIDPATGGVMLNAMGRPVNATPLITLPSVNIPGTPSGASDEESIFNASQDCDDPICTFSDADILALQTLYPCAACAQGPCFCPITPSIEGPTELCVGEVGIFCITGLEDGWTSTMTTAGNTVNLGTDDCLDIIYSEARVHTVSIEVCPDGLPDCCVTAWVEVNVFDEDAQCFCVCELWDPGDGTFGTDKNNIKFGTDKNNIKTVKGNGPYFEEIIQIDCCDERDCSEIVDDWWDEYLVDRNDCFKRVIPCEDPNVSLQGPDEVCIGETTQFCVSGLSGSTNWTVNGTQNNCIDITPSSTGNLNINVEVCVDDCCVTLTRTVEAKDCDICYCRCWIQEQSGDDDPYQEDIPVDCDDPGDCADIIPDWWYEYLTYPVDCEKI